MRFYSKLYSTSSSFYSSFFKLTANKVSYYLKSLVSILLKKLSYIFFYFSFFYNEAL